MYSYLKAGAIKDQLWLSGWLWNKYMLWMQGKNHPYFILLYSTAEFVENSTMKTRRGQNSKLTMGSLMKCILFGQMVSNRIRRRILKRQEGGHLKKSLVGGSCLGLMCTRG